MSLDKLIAAATDYFATGAEVHRRALAGGGGKITDLSEKPAPKTKVEKVTDVVAKPTAVVEQAASKEDTAKREAQDKAAAEAKADAAPTLTDEDLDGTDTALDYETDIRPVLRAKTLSNRAGLVALLAELGVKSGAELKPEQYAAFFEKLVAL